MSTVKIIITNWSEKGSSVAKYGRSQPGCKEATLDPQPHRAILKFEFDTEENARAADKAITTFAEGLGFQLG